MCSKCPDYYPTWKKILLCKGSSCGKCLRIFILVLFVLGLLVTIAILLWLLLRHQEPRFTLQDVTRYTFNVSTKPTCLITTTFQVTLSSFNPNDHTDIYFDSLKVHAAYQGEQITRSTSLPRTYERRNELNVWSPYLYGEAMPIAPDNALTMSRAKDDGVVVVTIKIHARARYRLRGGLKTRGTHISVDCPAYITFGTLGKGMSVVGDDDDNNNNNNNVVRYQLMQSCN